MNAAVLRSIIHDGLANCKTYLENLVFNLLYCAQRNQKDFDFSLMRNLILSLPAEEKAKYKLECEFIENLSLTELDKILFPYQRINDKIPFKVETGIEFGLKYVLHRADKKLFFPKYFSAEHAYKNFIEVEGILGSSSLLKSPHSYQDESFKVEEGDVILDVGCAEALFALDNIEKASRVFLFECNKDWYWPLKRTFAPYGDKVVYIPKLVTDKTDAKHTTLTDAINGVVSANDKLFVKMDIEGFERNVIESNEDFFRRYKVKLSCCTYHRQDDAKVIEKLLRNMGYLTRFSDGYMLPYHLNGIHYPYFRHGVIYAKNY
jgi:hypothetical protein